MSTHLAWITAQGTAMQNEQNHLSTQTQDVAPPPVWSAPQLVVVDAAMTQSSSANVGPDSGIYS
jgi:hypothetical protein